MRIGKMSKGGGGGGGGEIERGGRGSLDCLTIQRHAQCISSADQLKQ